MKINLQPDPDDGPTVSEVHRAAQIRQQQLKPRRDVIAFIEARLRDDEETARKAYGAGELDEWSQRWTIETAPHLPAKHVQGRPTIETGGMGWQTDSGDGIWSCDDPEDDCWQYRGQDLAEAAHIVRHDPVRALLEIQAKRAVLAAVAAEEPPPADEWGEVPMHPLLYALASVWRGHTDFQYAWSPE